MAQTHCNKALPVSASKRATGAKLIEHACGQMDELEDGPLTDNRRVQSCGGRNERHDCSVFGSRLIFNTSRLGQEVFHAEHLGCENAIERGEARIAFATKEIGKMRRAQACLTREKRAGKLPPIDTASYFHAKPLVELRKIHLWNFVCELYTLPESLLVAKAPNGIYQF
jgi:hypothetical protein